MIQQEHRDSPSPAETKPGQTPPAKSQFERLEDDRQYSLVEEFWFFLKEHKKWWLMPILVVFAVMGLLIVLGSTGAAPFIYTLW
jgi:hypothetical protein